MLIFSASICMGIFGAFHQFIKFLSTSQSSKICQLDLHCQLPILYIMSQPSELTTATNVFIHFNGIFVQGTMVQCINLKVYVFILQKKNLKSLYAKLYTKLLSVDLAYNFLYGHYFSSKLERRTFLITNAQIAIQSNKV